MVPILLVSRDKRQTNKFIREFIDKHGFGSGRVLEVRPEKTVISIDQIRAIKAQLTRADTERLLIVIWDFETSKPETQNAFLKTLEEKTHAAQFIAVVADQSKVLPTVASRCRAVRLAPKHKARGDLTFDFSKPLGRLFSEYSDIKKDKAVKLLDDLIWYFKREMETNMHNGEKSSAGSRAAILKEILATRNLILRNNLNAQMGVDHVFVTITKSLK